MNIYVGNLSYDTLGEELQEVFSAFGEVVSAKIIRDKFTGDSKGFGFVEMPNSSEAQAALQGITEIKGRQIVINEARPLTGRSPFGGKNGPSRNKGPRGGRKF
ncbi:MAG: RNA-binding protein [Candidatus Omnitrophica bacterium]|nr:RNA-binding protein [Candidatus Omnitrophota bacterium]MCB9719488.1 RNA-binding protein [Candidatus Omnitrophota bacterium]